MRPSSFEYVVLALFFHLSIAKPDAQPRMMQSVSGEGNLLYLVAARQNAQIVNVRDWGARGDGVTDDTAAIQKSIDAATAGQTILFPAGVYSVANLQIKNRSGLVFSGEGR